MLVLHVPPMIRGGVRDFIQQSIACGHLKRSTHSGGQQRSDFALVEFSEELSHPSVCAILIHSISLIESA